MRQQTKKRKPGLVRDTLVLIIVVLLTGVLLMIFPEKTEPVINTAGNYFLEMILILPAVMIIMGIFSVFISNEMVVKYLGKSSGVKGVIVSVFLGMLPTGPLYVAFPIASSLMKKGAKISNIILFLSSWACIKLPQELAELQFLGFEFMITRLTLTIIFVLIMGFAIEMLIQRTQRNPTESTTVTSM